MTSSSLFKQCNFKAIKARQPGGWTSCHHETLESAKSWIAPCDHYVIFDDRGPTPKVIESKNWDAEADSAIWDSLEEDNTKVNVERVQHG